MAFILSVYLVLSLVSFFAFFEDRKDVYTKAIFLSVVVVLTFLVAFRPMGVDADSINYSKIYSDPSRMEDKEHSFILIANAVHYLFNDPRGLLVVYAFLSVPIMALAIKKNSCALLLSVVMWFAQVLIQHNMTQIRSGVAASLFVFSLYYLAQGKRIAYLLLNIAGAFFHLSALIYIPFVVFSGKPMKVWMRWLCVGVVVALYVMYVMGKDLWVALPIPGMQERIEQYQLLLMLGQWTERPNVFNPIFLFRVMVFFLLLWKHDYIVKQYPQISLFLKIYLFDFVCRMGFLSLPVVAARLSDMINPVEIFLFPALIYVFRPIFVGRMLVMLFTIVHMSIAIWIGHSLKVL